MWQCIRSRFLSFADVQQHACYRGEKSAVGVAMFVHGGSHEYGGERKRERERERERERNRHREKREKRTESARGELITAHHL